MPNRVEVKSVELCSEKDSTPATSLGVIPSGFLLVSKDHTEKDSTPATCLGVVPNGLALGSEDHTEKKFLC